MEAKIQELTDKLYREGVEKGEAEAARLIDEAQNRRKKMADEAKSEADEIINKAQKKAAEMKKNTESELKLYASQSVEALKSEITNLITDKVTTSAVKSAFDTPDFMQQLILKLVSEWPKKETLVIGSEDAAALKSYFEVNAKELLDKGVKIEQVNGKKHAFSIAPADGTYKINFGEEEFIEYFKDFLRPQLIDLLF
ncbi:hypothetical protein LJC68_08875 [Bacteroidales bacterium OttesenSCG-928-B11]|nr:hypothetical protein [Bacteroidales bacterium OttesenSCG-928-E04]MDL2308178.1 hypothetical protein [Bacteroidales bacterium OttesenSCG-928-C03]MDL2312972.1 hypothetical protein [Bacteroidales bacterium OttesenSCG-928-B11]MDL2325617.1 hypothetical protein [Bacteroidales bacterium OttesenSCG-928-A14]